MNQGTVLNTERGIDKMSQWFDGFISSVITDQIMLETQSAPKNKREMYNTLISGNEAEIHNMGRVSASLYFIKMIVTSYIEEIITSKVKIQKLALNVSDSKILSWAEVADDDDESVDKLMLCEAKVNALCFQYGFHITTTVVEECDGMQAPKHYNTVDLQA